MSEIEKIVIATHNPAKVERYGRLFSGLVDQVLGLDDLGIIDKPTETGDTAEQNSQIKALFYATQSGLLVFSEDEALYVDFLPEDKQPGTFVRRINGEDEATDAELFKYWSQIVKNVPVEKRTGHWHIAYTLANTDGKYKTISLDHPIRFYYPPSIIKWPGWPMSSLQGKIIFTKPQTEYNADEKKRDEKSANEAIVLDFIKLIKEFEDS